MIALFFTLMLACINEYLYRKIYYNTSMKFYVRNVQISCLGKINTSYIKVDFEFVANAGSRRLSSA